MSCLLAWISVILITIIIFPSYQFLMGLHMNVKKQQTNSKGLFIKSIFIPPSVWEKNHSSMFSRISGTIKPAYYTI